MRVVDVITLLDLIPTVVAARITAHIAMQGRCLISEECGMLHTLLVLISTELGTQSGLNYGRGK